MSDSIVSKIILVSIVMLGVGFVASNIATVVLTGYELSETVISSSENAIRFSGLTLFLIAFVVMLIIGVFIIIGGTQFNIDETPPRRIVWFGLQIASIYLLCLGIGSLFLSEMQQGLVLLVGSVLIMVGTGVYISGSHVTKTIGSGIWAAGGILLAYSNFQLSPLELIFNWEVPFTGLFFSMPTTEAIAILIVSLGVVVHTFCSEILELESHLNKPILCAVGIIFGVGVFAGSLQFCLNILNHVWKAEWLPPFYGLPDWVMNTLVYWAASTVVLEIGAILLIVASCLGFVETIKEF
jgi:hypothetical protein